MSLRLLLLVRYSYIYILVILKHPNTQIYDSLSHVGSRNTHRLRNFSVRRLTLALTLTFAAGGPSSV